ncbi:hypothetical protein ETB97_006285 [Aspergillus alliaceus]|uniref:Uncharacterized protein n=1 Tax=Petromyces alliaceus TaxID=209559 RepID=A0A8H6E3F7_PETAA|nr:hypothetical protein ETB97_006285 [Aspergillus burnettii]
MKSRYLNKRHCRDSEREHLYNDVRACPEGILHDIEHFHSLCLVDIGFEEHGRPTYEDEYTDRIEDPSWEVCDRDKSIARVYVKDHEDIEGEHGESSKKDKEEARWTDGQTITSG